MKNLKFLLVASLLAAVIIPNSTFAQNSRKKSAVQSESTVISTDNELIKSLSNDVARRDALAAHIENLTAEMNRAKKSKAKKINKELMAAQAEYDAIKRVIASYPPSVTNPSIKREAQDRDSEQFRKEMEQKLEEKMSQIDMKKEAIADVTDPELRRAYENYREGDENIVGQQSPLEMRVYFSVQIGSGKTGQARTFRGINEVVEKRGANGRAIYCVGAYATEAEARSACEKIRTTTSYRDAYVIAFSDSKLISIDQARRMQ